MDKNLGIKLKRVAMNEIEKIPFMASKEMFSDIRFRFFRDIADYCAYYRNKDKDIVSRFDSLWNRKDVIFKKLRCTAVKYVLGRHCEAEYNYLYLKNKEDVLLARKELERLIDELIYVTENTTVHKDVIGKLTDMPLSIREEYELKQERYIFQSLIEEILDELWDNYYKESLLSYMTTWYDNNQYNMQKEDFYKKKWLVERIKREIYTNWTNFRNSAIKRVTNNRVCGIVNKCGYVQITDKELREIKKVIIEEMAAYIEKIFARKMK